MLDITVVKEDPTLIEVVFETASINVVKPDMSQIDVVVD